jgi:hypothetical protein
MGWKEQGIWYLDVREWQILCELIGGFDQGKEGFIERSRRLIHENRLYLHPTLKNSSPLFIGQKEGSFLFEISHTFVTYVLTRLVKCDSCSSQGEICPTCAGDGLLVIKERLLSLAEEAKPGKFDFRTLRNKNLEEIIEFCKNEGLIDINSPISSPYFNPPPPQYKSAFWQKHFSEKESVNWRQLVLTLYDHLNLLSQFPIENFKKEWKLFIESAGAELSLVNLSKEVPAYSFLFTLFSNLIQEHQGEIPRYAWDAFCAHFGEPEPGDVTFLEQVKAFLLDVEAHGFQGFGDPDQLFTKERKIGDYCLFFPKKEYGSLQLAFLRGPRWRGREIEKIALIPAEEKGYFIYGKEHYLLSDLLLKLKTEKSLIKPKRHEIIGKPFIPTESCTTQSLDELLNENWQICTPWEKAWREIFPDTMEVSWDTFVCATRQNSTPWSPLWNLLMGDYGRRTKRQTENIYWVSFLNQFYNFLVLDTSRVFSSVLPARMPPTTSVFSLKLFLDKKSKTIFLDYHCSAESEGGKKFAAFWDATFPQKLRVPLSQFIEKIAEKIALQPDAEYFWKKHFKDRKEATWNQFVTALYTELQEPLPDEAPLQLYPGLSKKVMEGEKGSKVPILPPTHNTPTKTHVSLKMSKKKAIIRTPELREQAIKYAFLWEIYANLTSANHKKITLPIAGLIFSLFGGPRSLVDGKVVTILDRIYAFVNDVYPFYHGWVSHPEERLKNKTNEEEAAAYLLRVSDRVVAWVVSYWFKDGRTRHTRIHIDWTSPHAPYVFDGKRYASIKEIINTKPVFKYPVPGDMKYNYSSLAYPK